VKGDIALQSERIVRIGTIQPTEGDVVLDVSGKMVCPGFIDIHTHSDTTFFFDRYASSKVCQGVTTEVVGNCGMSCAPLLGEGGRSFLRVNSRLFGESLQVNWESMDEYLVALEGNELPLNVAALVGHSTVRACVMGYAARPPSENEKHEMARLVEDALRAGAFGMSLGYKPGDQADEDELVFLGRIVARHGGFVADHSAQLSWKRGQGEDGDKYDGLTSVIRRLLRVGERAEVPVHISHVKAIGPVVWVRAHWITDLIDRARARGVDATCDLYGYTVGGGGLRGLFAPQFLLEGASSQDVPAAIRAAIQDENVRHRALKSIELSFRSLGGADKVRIVSFTPDESVNGKTFQDVAQEMGQTPAEVALAFLQQGDARLQCEVMVERDVMTLMQHPTAMICSDAVSMSVDGPGAKEMTHPRTFGAFPRILRRYVLEFGTLSLPEAIKKMTTLPAQRLGLQDRGRLQEGCYADLVVFDPQAVTDRATFSDPFRSPIGIDYVFVNGALAARDGRYNQALAGKVLRKTAR
jgi:N-acyl-D-amino-acid deacylase